MKFEAWAKCNSSISCRQKGYFHSIDEVPATFQIHVLSNEYHECKLHCKWVSHVLWTGKFFLVFWSCTSHHWHSYQIHVSLWRLSLYHNVANEQWCINISSLGCFAENKSKDQVFHEYYTSWWTKIQGRSSMTAILWRVYKLHSRAESFLVFLSHVRQQALS